MKFGVIGLGRFGYHVATVLAENGMDVLAVDSNESIVSSIRDQVTRAVCLRITDEESLRSIGVDEMDTVIIGMGENFAQSILATALTKKHLKVKNVITRAIDDIHSEILTLVGSDRIILPEQEIGIKLAQSLSAPFVVLARLSTKCVIGEIEAPPIFFGEYIRNIDSFDDNTVTCIGFRRDNELFTPTHKLFNDLTIQNGDMLIVLGEQHNIARLAKL
jgi:trk system potassium uptake protein TrkA